MDKLNKGDVLRYTGRTPFNPNAAEWHTDLTIGKEYTVKHVKGVILLVGEEAKGVAHKRDEMVIIDDVGDEVTLSNERLENFETVKRGCMQERDEASKLDDFLFKSLVMSGGNQVHVKKEMNTDTIDSLKDDKVTIVYGAYKNEVPSYIVLEQLIRVFEERNDVDYLEMIDLMSNGHW